MLAGTSLGMTSVFYYLTVKYIPVPLVLFYWCKLFDGVLLEMILEKPFYPENHISSYRIDWNRFGHQLNQKWSSFRLVWNYVGNLAAALFTTTMFTANRVAIEISSAQRSLYMFGGAVIVFHFR
jgi:hypothetical protein